MSSNYGIDTLTPQALQDILYTQFGNSAGLFGPVELIDGKYYLTMIKDGVNILSPEFYKATGDNLASYYEVADVISVSTPPKEAAEIIRRNIQDRNRFAPTNTYDNNTLKEFISEVENYSKSEIGHIRINDDGTVDIYNLDGDYVVTTTIKSNNDSTSNNKYDLSDIEKVLEPPEKINLNEKLDDKNKEIIEDYISQLTGLDKVELQNTENGYYTEVNGKIIVFDNDSTLSKAINVINDEFKNEKSLGLNKSLATNKIQQQANSQRIFIDVPGFESAMGNFSSAEELVSEAKGSYNPGVLIGKLKSAFGSLGLDTSPDKKLMGTANLIATMSSNIKYSLKAYENIDHRLGIIINSIIDEIFSMNNYTDKETQEYYETSDLGEREKKFDEIIVDLGKQLEQIKKEYEAKYPGDLSWFNQNITDLLRGVGNSFGVFGDEYYTVKGNDVIVSFTKAIEFIQNNNLLDKLKSYSEGASFKDSGLASIYINSHGLDNNNLNDDNYLRKAENGFLNKYLLFNYDSKFNNMHAKGAGTLGATSVYEFNEDEIITIKNHIKMQLKEFSSLKAVVQNKETFENEEITGFDLIKYYANDITEYEAGISETNNRKASYEKYREIMPYEAEMQGDTYLEYLVQDWNKLNVDEVCPELIDKIQYMSQRELSLYLMYKGVPLDNPTIKNYLNDKADQNKATGYLNSIDDLINQRHGLEMAVERIKAYNDWIKNGGVGGLVPFFSSGFDGIKDGIDGFFENIGRVLTANGKQSANDYRDTFMLSLLSNNVQSEEIGDICKSLGINDLDDKYMSVLKRNYTVFKSVGTMAIPTAASFIPGVGQVLSKTLIALNTLGSSAQSAMVMQLQQGNETDAVRAYLYAGANVATTLLMNRYMSGITGINGELTPPKGAEQFLTLMIKQGGRATAGVVSDSVLRATILGQPIDVSRWPADMIEAAINGALTAAILNGSSKAALKIANGFVYHFSDKYNSYDEVMLDMQQQFNDSKFGKALNMLMKIGGPKSEQTKMKWDKTVVGKWMKEANDSNKYGLMDLEAKNIIGHELQEGQHLVFDADRMDYYIYDENTGSALNVPKNWLSMHEPGPIENTYKYGKFGTPIVKDFLIYYYENPLNQSEEDQLDRLYDTGIRIDGVTKNGHFVIMMPNGEMIEVTRDILFSQNLYDEITEQQISLIQDWTIDELPALYNKLGILIPQEKIDDLRDSITIFKTRDDYIEYLMKDGVDEFTAKNSAGVLHNRKIFAYFDEYTKCKIVHEADHFLGTVTDFDMNTYQWVYRGLDESLTESFSHVLQATSDEYYPSYVSYQAGVSGIETLMNARIPGLTTLDFMQAYYVTNDMSTIRETMDEFMGPGYFDNTFAPAFDTVLIESDKDTSVIDDVVADVLYFYDNLYYNSETGKTEYGKPPWALKE